MPVREANMRFLRARRTRGPDRGSGQDGVPGRGHGPAPVTCRRCSRTAGGFAYTPLLAVILDLGDGSGLGLVRILTELAAGTALTEEVPALVE